MTSTQQRRPPGPKREKGAPVGPEEVREAILRTAARLFAERGVDAVSLREIATEADVHLALIARYVGNREELVSAVFDFLSEAVAEEVMGNPLAGQGFDTDTAMGQWVRVTGGLVISGRQLKIESPFNPVQAMARTLREGYGLDEQSARICAAQIVGSALGWRIFEDYLVGAGELRDVPLQELRDDLVHSARRVGATPWPSPPDPLARRSARPD